MNITETTELLAVIAASDRRTVGETDIEVWFDALADLDFDDCRAAVRAHTKQSKDWLTPYDVRQGVKRIRAERLARTVEAPPAADPDDVPAYLAALRAGRTLDASGTRQVPAQIASTFRSIPRGSA